MLTLESNDARYQIRSFHEGKIQVNDTVFEHSIIISANQLLPWNPACLNDLHASDLIIIQEMKPEILLLGTGKNLSFPDIALYGDLINQGIGIEIMDTAAACRTFNALVAEDRNVIAALLIH